MAGYKTKDQKIKELTSERDFYRNLLQDSLENTRAWREHCQKLEDQIAALTEAISKLGGVKE
jgi:flagellar biosynthesis chaperone FliJ